MKIYPLSLLLVIVGLVATEVAAAPVMTSTYYGYRPGALEKTKALIAQGDKAALSVLKSLTKEADKFLDDKPLTVTDKKVASPTGDIRDYVSLAPYFWPNPKTQDGLPYVRKDGEVNPESKNPDFADDTRVLALARRMKTLGLAYYFTGDEKYGSKAVEQIRVWFVDEKTKMNPHMKFSQGVRGESTGRFTGMMDGRHIAMAADATALIVNSTAWKAGEREAAEVWFKDFFEWMLNGELGKAEGESKNNHGTHYDVQIVRWALHVGRTDVAKQFLERAKEKRIALQVQPDGKQPLELSRTNSLSYSQFNLKALTSLAIMGEYVGVDLWNYKTTDGRCIAVALDYLLPYLDVPRKPWPYKQIVPKKAEVPEILPELRIASTLFKKPDYLAVAAKYADLPTLSKVDYLVGGF
jgi:hypothetical protein